MQSLCPIIDEFRSEKSGRNFYAASDTFHMISRKNYMKFSRIFLHNHENFVFSEKPLFILQKLWYNRETRAEIFDSAFHFQEGLP